MSQMKGRITGPNDKTPKANCWILEGGPWELNLLTHVPRPDDDIVPALVSDIVV